MNYSISDNGASSGGQFTGRTVEQLDRDVRLGDLGFRTMADAFGEKIPLDFIVDELIHRKSLTVAYGSAGSYKSYFLQHLALSVANGKHWLNRTTKRGVVLWYDEEMGQQLSDWRVHAVTRSLDIDDVNAIPFYYRSMTGWNLFSDASLKKLDEELAIARPTLVIIDSLAAVKGGAKEDSNDDMRRLCDSVRGVALDRDCAIIIIHHTGKNQQLDGRGASAIRDVADLTFRVSKKQVKNTNIERITCSHDKSRSIPKFKPIRTYPHIVRDSNRMVICFGLSTSAGIYTCEQFLLACADRHPVIDSSLLHALYDEHAGKLKFRKESMRDELSRLADIGKLERPSRGQYKLTDIARNDAGLLALEIFDTDCLEEDDADE